MTTTTLIIGSKSVSTWSLRPWILMKELGMAFDEIVIALDRNETRQEILKHSAAARVPCLKEGEFLVWDSLSIIEYLAEKNPQVWPRDRLCRAWARSACAEMHSSFQAMRTHLSAQFLKEGLSYPHDDPQIRAELARIQSIWMDGLHRWKGPFLAGAQFTAADAFFAPVVSRFRTYGVVVADPQIRQYMDRIWNLPSYQTWLREARQATDTIA